jgi:arabinofuranosyltransferase
MPNLSGFIMPVVVLWIPTRWLPRPAEFACVAAAVVVAAWGLVAATSLRVPPKAEYEPVYVADERSFYVLTAGNPHPITIDDYRRFDLPWLRQGRDWHALAERNVRLLVIGADLQIMRNEIPPPADIYPLRANVDDVITVVAPAWKIGMSGFIAGPHVLVVDHYGLADPIAARVPREVGTRAGHAKKLRLSWVIARYADPAAAVPFPPDAAAARETLRCGPLAYLITAVEEPLTIGRFLENLRNSWRFTRLRVGADPVVAVTKLCRADDDR